MRAKANQVHLGGGLQAERHTDGRLSLTSGAWALQLDPAQVQALVKLLAPTVASPDPADVTEKQRIALRERLALSVTEAAELLGIDRSTFHRQVMPAVYTGKIHSRTLGKKRLITAESLLAWWYAENGTSIRG